MRVLAGFLILVIAGFISLAVVQREAAQASRSGYDVLVEALQCLVFYRCPFVIEDQMRADLRDRFRDSVAISFKPPRWAEPAPSPDRLRRAEAILECSFEDFESASDVEFSTQPGRAWVEGEPSPAALVALAEAEDAQAQWELGFGLASGRSGEFGEDIESEAFEWLTRAAENGHASAQAELGAAYSMGYFFQDINWTLARTHLRAAVAQGDPVAAMTLAIAPPEDGRDLGEYASERLDLELESANACYRDAAVLIADRLYDTDRGFKRDPALADAILAGVSGLDPETRSVRHLPFRNGS